MHLDSEKNILGNHHAHDHASGEECVHGCHHHDHHDHCDHHHGDHSHSYDYAPGPLEGKTGILLTAFGCALPDTHYLYDRFEDEVRERYPDMDVRWAFTANRIRRKLSSRGIPAFSVAEALSQMIDDGFSHVAVQSLHTLPGVEYDWVEQQARSMCHPRKGLSRVTLGAPMLNKMEDLDHTVQAVSGYLPPDRKEDEGVILIGHGTYHKGHTAYMALEGLLSRSLPNVLVGTLMDKSGPAELGSHFLDRGISKIHLVPFMCVPGHHVQVDLFGEGEKSWKSILSGMGCEVLPVFKGSLEHKDFRNIWHDHLAEAVAELKVD
ncbi:sirohydrochlorin cobaltochelatase [Maridesulfovibrio sp.]|uniref:sirohydrochlorin cobaltochelatase n=1 Tax=Maridesulfovibrio sp. TaxID=2795000 RepID=UPI002A18B83C|nr:sirohydrochlorin cobaltochelatase [Maridesulfovibrio sp.]